MKKTVKVPFGGKPGQVEIRAERESPHHGREGTLEGKWILLWTKIMLTEHSYRVNDGKGGGGET